MAAQYANDGWPQQWPLPGTEPYAAHITYNDYAMISMLRLPGDVAADKGDFAFASEETRAACKRVR